MPNTMRAMRIHATGGTDTLQLETVPVPTPGRGEALVRVQDAGVNFIDVYKRTGQYKIPLPATLGEEGAGVVAAIGEDVPGVATGDRVAWASIGGAYAEYAVVPADRLVPIPEGVTTQQAAALMLQGMTAHYLATSTFPLEEGDTCLVHAAAGGVGLLLVQIAKRRGARVIGTAGSDQKAGLAKEAGADEVIVYTREDFVESARGIAGPDGIDVIYDSVGKSTFLSGLDLLKQRGMMVLFGQSSGAVDPIDPQTLNRQGSLFLTRPTLHHYVADRDELLWRANELFKWVADGSLKVTIGAEFPLDQVANAHEALEGRRTIGKVVIEVA